MNSSQIRCPKSFTEIRSFNCLLAYMKTHLLSTAIVIAIILIAVIVTIWGTVGSSDKKEPFANIDRSKPVIIAYTAKWCPHCQRLEPIWDRLTEKLEAQGVQVRKIECTENKKACEKANVKSYPTIHKILPGSKTPIEYKGIRALSPLMSFALA